MTTSKTYKRRLIAQGRTVNLADHSGIKCHSSTTALSLFWLRQYDWLQSCNYLSKLLPTPLIFYVTRRLAGWMELKCVYISRWFTYHSTSTNTCAVLLTLLKQWVRIKEDNWTLNDDKMTWSSLRSCLISAALIHRYRIIVIIVDDKRGWLNA